MAKGGTPVGGVIPGGDDTRGNIVAPRGHILKYPDVVPGTLLKAHIVACKPETNQGDLHESRGDKRFVGNSTASSYTLIGSVDVGVHSRQP